LRLARSGREVTLSAAEGASREFREVGRSELGPEDLTLVRLSAYPGHAQNALDLLLKDVRVHSLSKAEAQTPATAPETAPASVEVPQAAKGWAGTAGFVLVLILIAVGGTWLYLRWNSQDSKSVSPNVVSKSAPVRGQDSKSPAAISVACAACGKTLRARAELAGKRIKCPKCGKAVSVLTKSY
jgi:DNA-directed RNA polymerase subunit RPC12/RpoP